MITFLEKEETGIQKKSTLGNLLKYKDKIKSFPQDPVAYQRELRDFTQTLKSLVIIKIKYNNRFNLGFGHCLQNKLST